MFSFIYLFILRIGFWILYVIYIDFDGGEISNLPFLYVKFEEEKG